LEKWQASIKQTGLPLVFVDGVSTMIDLDFLIEINKNPFVDGPRLIFADWIKIQSSGRSAFIKAQCKLPHIQKSIEDLKKDDNCYRQNLSNFKKQETKCRQDEAAFNPYELWNNMDIFHIYKQNDQESFENNDRFAAALYVRGFIQEFNCFMQYWLYVAKFMKYEPIQLVRIKGKLPQQDSYGKWYWVVKTDWQNDVVAIPPQLVNLAEVPNNQILRFEQRDEALKYLSDRCLSIR